MRGGTESPSFANVRAKIEFDQQYSFLERENFDRRNREYTHHDVGAEGTIEIQRGFLEIV